jgi:hypothetical protein
LARHEISQHGVPIAAEDKFLVFAFGKGRLLAPHSNDADHLGEMIQSMEVRIPGITPIFDLRGLEGYYNDIHTFIESVGGPDSYVLLGDAEVDAGWEESLKGYKMES